MWLRRTLGAPSVTSLDLLQVWFISIVTLLINYFMILIPLRLCDGPLDVSGGGVAPLARASE